MESGKKIGKWKMSSKAWVFWGGRKNVWINKNCQKFSSSGGGLTFLVLAHVHLYFLTPKGRGYYVFPRIFFLKNWGLEEIGENLGSRNIRFKKFLSKSNSTESNKKKYNYTTTSLFSRREKNGGFFYTGGWGGKNNMSLVLLKQWWYGSPAITQCAG